jgi:hypothetical protein
MMANKAKPGWREEYERQQMYSIKAARDEARVREREQPADDEIKRIKPQKETKANKPLIKIAPATCLTPGCRSAIPARRVLSTPSFWGGAHRVDGTRSLPQTCVSGTPKMCL